jgi:predicted O-methyltransferase YrrM
MIRAAFPDGHFYSPVIDPEEIGAARNRIWSDNPADPPGIDFQPERQQALLRSVAVLARDFDYAGAAPSGWNGTSFYEANGKFAELDARMLFCLLRLLRPARLVEVGSGFSTLLAADVNTRFMGGATRLTCIEPFPPEFLRADTPGIHALLEQRVQEVPLAVFEELTAGDVLFIDSSHVVKTGSDVVFLHLEVLPRLRRGVVVHVHDVFLPEDYPAEWVLGEQRSWSEQYLLRALLTHSCAWEILFGCNYARLRFPGVVREVFGELHGGGSFWIRRL